MKKLRVALLLFLVALSLPLSWVLTRTYSGLRQEEVSRLRFFATALFDAMEGELAELVLREEGRPVDAYGSNEPDGIAPPLPREGIPASTEEAPLTTLPTEPWLRGYLQNHPDGSFQTPLAVGDAATRQRREELASFNTRFNTLRYQAPRPLSPPAARPAVKPGVPAAQGAAEEALSESAAPEEGFKTEVGTKTTAAPKGYADSVLYQTAPSKARSALARKKTRVEQLTATQARKVTRRPVEKSVAPKPPSPIQASLNQDDLEAEGPDTGQADTAQTDTATAEADIGQATDTNAVRVPLQQVEVAPFQALLIDEGHAFIFRRILIEGRAYRQGFVIDLSAFGEHLLAAHFADQPLARFTQLQLWIQTGTGAHLMSTLGRSPNAPSLEMERRFPRPFAFLQARLICSEIPPSSARAPLRLALLALGIVLLVGLLAIYRSVNAQVALSHRRSQFASAVTHELKTPLTTIRMYVEMLEQGMAGDPRRQKRYFQVLDTETGRLGRLINNVLELSRLEKRQRPLTYSHGDLNEVVEKVAAALGPQIEAAGFDFRVENRLKQPFAYDGEVLVQVLINLIENSLKFGRDGERREIRLTMERRRQGVRIAVTDTGPGIPRGDLKRIFEDFYRAEDEMTRTTAGTGIGLALVKRFTAAMGGRVKATNNAEGGCTIALVIPVDPQDKHNR